MGRRAASLILTIGLAAAVVSATAFFAYQPSRHVTSAAEPSITAEGDLLRSFLMDRDLYERAFEKVAPVGEEPDRVVAGIVPHHLLAARLIARFFSVWSGRCPSTMVIAGPNHNNLGPAPIQTVSLNWLTPYGIAQADTWLIQDLVEKHVAVHEEPVFFQEHSISSLTPFITRLCPDTKIVPIILKSPTRAEDISDLAAELNRVLPADAVVIGSIDFSHYVSSDIADRQDAQTIPVLQRIGDFRNNEIFADSPETVRLIMEYAKLRGADGSTLLENSNAAKLAQQPDLAEVTSYITLYYTRGTAP